MAKQNIDIEFYNDNLNYELDRAQGVYGDANNAAVVCILGFILAYRHLKHTTTLKTAFKAFALIACAYALFLTLSTTGFACFVLVISLLNYKFFSKQRIILLFLLVPIFYALLFNLDVLTADLDLNIRQRHKIQNFVNLVQLNFSEVDTSGRSDMVSGLMEFIYENPIFGRGLEFGLQKQSHNTFIYIWSDAGILTVLFFIFLMFTYFKKSLQLVPNKRYYILAMLTTLTVFMLSLQTIINQPYLMPLFIYISYMVERSLKGGAYAEGGVHLPDKRSTSSIKSFTDI
ncbi:MAG: O-antigen ligase family protein [Allomuricauda sp.]